MTTNSPIITIPQVEEVFLRLPNVMARTGMSKAEIYRRMSDGRFPKAVRLSHKMAVWRRSEVEAWMRSKFEQPAAPKTPDPLDDLL